MANRRQQTTRRPIPVGVWILITMIFIAELFAYTWCRVQNVGLGYEISALSRECRQLMVIENKFKMQLALLKSPERLSIIAQSYGLVTPGPDMKLVLP